MVSLARTAAISCALLAIGALAGCGGAKVGRPGAPSSGTAAASTGASQTGSATATGAGRTHEVADPEEADSFPAPAGVKHASASTPRRASEAIVAAGAPTDAEIKAELKQEEAVQRAASATRGKHLAPVPGGESIGGNGTIPIPSDVPETVQKVIAGANEIADFPYVFGGGHASFIDNAYDCSGSVSYALAAGGLLSSPEVSGELEKWGVPGPGRYITVYATAGHAYMYVDGVLFDTAGRSGVYASRWQVTGTDNGGYVARHWPGL